MVCWIANDSLLSRANCFPNDRVISNWNRCSHIHWPIYLLHRNMDQKTEIRNYIKCRIRLNIDSKQIFYDLCGIYGPQTISVRTVLGGLKLLQLGNFLLKMIPVQEGLKPLLPAVKIVVEQKRNCLSKIQLVVLAYQMAVCKQFWKSVWTWERFALGGYLICSLRSKRHNALNVSGNFWNEGCNSRVISNLLTDDETWVHMFEPQRRADNKQWKRKDKKRPCIAKRTISSKKMLYAISFNSSGPVVEVPCPPLFTWPESLWLLFISKA